MKRKIYAELLAWKRQNADKYALLIEGARRVGKSWIVRTFAENEYASHLIIDFASHAFSENRNATFDVQWKILTGKLEVNKGMLMENVVAQALRCSGQQLYFHCNNDQENAANRMEIEFLLSRSHTGARHNIYPVEVKSANDYTTASMDKFVRKFSPNVARPIVLHPGDASFDGPILKLPLYMAMLIPELA